MAFLKELIVNGVTKVMGKLKIGNAPVHGDGTLVLNSSNYTNYYDSTEQKLVNIPQNTRLIVCNGLTSGTTLNLKDIDIAGITNKSDGQIDGMRISLLNHDNHSGFSLRGGTRIDMAGKIYLPNSYLESNARIAKDREMTFLYWGYAWYPSALY